MGGEVIGSFNLKRLVLNSAYASLLTGPKIMVFDNVFEINVKLPERTNCKFPNPTSPCPHTLLHPVRIPYLTLSAYPTSPCPHTLLHPVRIPYHILSAYPTSPRPHTLPHLGQLALVYIMKD